MKLIYIYLVIVIVLAAYLLSTKPVEYTNYSPSLLDRIK